MKYLTKDHEVFDTKEEALEHEQFLADIADLMALAGEFNESLAATGKVATRNLNFIRAWEIYKIETQQQEELEKAA